ncbi:MAG: DEAD/DEAH box helicase [Microthrixaceae bacterium]
MFDPTLNATLMPGVVPRDLEIALWSTPESLAGLVPLTVRPDDSDAVDLGPDGSDLAGDGTRSNGDERNRREHRPVELQLSLPGGRIESVPATTIRLRDLIDEFEYSTPDPDGMPQPGFEAVPGSTQSPSSRSVLALAHVTGCALGLVARSAIHPDITDDGLDIWALGRLDPDESELIDHLARWIPPELYCGATASAKASSDDASPLHLSGPEAIRAVYNAVVDLMPRTPSSAAVLGTPSWLSDGHTDVSAYAERLRSEAVLRRSVLQLRLVLPDSDDDDASIHLFIRNESSGFLAVSASDLWAGVVETDPKSEEDLLLLTRRAARTWSPLARALEERSPSRISINDDEVSELLDHAAADLISAGIEVMVPQELIRQIGGAPNVRVAESFDDNTTRSSSGLFTIDSLCEVNWSLQVDGRELSSEEVDALIDSKRQLIRLNDGWVMVDRTVLKRLRSSENLSAAQSLGELLAAGNQPLGDDTAAGFAQMWPSEDSARFGPYGTLVNAADDQITSFLRDVRFAMTDEEFAPPKGLVGDLRPYQRAGLAWMLILSRSRFGGILADDMGLGKTIQVIALHLALTDGGARYQRNPDSSHISGSHADSASGPDSVSGPDSGPGATLVIAPTGLIHNWSIELSRWAPGVRVHQYHGPERSLDEVSDGDVVLSTYGIVRRDRERLASRHWGLLIADEAQAIKNRTSATALAIRSLPAVVRFALTGTPVENHLGELWSILDWTTPGLLGPVTRFERSIVEPIERGEDPRATAKLSRMVGPFLLRRTKSDPRIVPELPPRTLTDHVVPLTTEQSVLYRAASQEILESISSASGMARRGAILKLLTALKQVSNHPAQFLGQDGPIEGRSGKFALAADLVEEIVESGQSVVIFTQYVTMGNLLVAGLAAHGSLTTLPPPEMLHGSVSIKDRASLVERFQARELPIMVVSLRAGGVGLNLTAATHVIHYDRWWNPAVENQASDRVWRIGQDKPVQVHRLMSEGTVEEKIAALLESKQQLADLVLDEAGWLTEMSDADLVALVELGDGSPQFSTFGDDDAGGGEPYG